MPAQPARTCETAGPSSRTQSDVASANGILLGGKYDIRKKIELYKGSVSTVYKCLLARGSPVVVKTYHKAKMADKHFHKLEREVAAMRALCREVGKKGVVQLMDTFEDSHGIYLVMECCEGGDLFKRLMISGGKLPESWVAVEVIAPLLRVLEHMHELHLMHRDIKPENLFITAEGEVKLGDFGLAIDWAQELPFSRSGTLDYMAPEVLMNPATHTQESPAIAVPHLLSKNIRPYTAAVDVWAVGCLAYELVCGRPPFEVEDEKQTASLIIYSNNIRFDPSATPAWADFVTQALIKDPRQRPDASTLLGHAWIRANLERAVAHAPATVAQFTRESSPFVAARGAAPAEPANAGRTSGAPQQQAAGPVSSTGRSSSACGSGGGASFATDNSSNVSGATTVATVPSSQRIATSTAAAVHGTTTAHGFRTAAAMLANRASQQQGCMTPPPALSTTSVSTPTSPGPPGSLFSAAPSSAPPTQEQHSQQQQRVQLAPTTRPSAMPHRANNLGSTGALRSLLDAFKTASLNSNSGGTGSSAAGVPPTGGSGAGSGGAPGYGSSSSVERSGRSASGGRPPSAGVGSSNTGNNAAPASSLLRTSFQFQKPSEWDLASNTGKLARTSFQVQLSTPEREPSLGGLSTAAVVGCRAPSCGPRDPTPNPSPEALPRYVTAALSVGAAPLDVHQQAPSHSSSFVSASQQPVSQLQLPFAAGAAPAGGAALANSGGGTGGGFTSPSRMARGNAATTGGLAPGAGISGVHFSSFLRPVGSLSAAGGCGSGTTGPNGSSGPESTAVGHPGKPPRPQSESPGKVFAMAVAAVAASQGNNASSPLRRAIQPSPPRAAPPSVSPPRPQPSASPPRVRPSSSGPRGDWMPPANGAAGQSAAATLHDLTRSWGAVVSISVGKYGNTTAGGGGYTGRVGSGSAFASPSRSPAGPGGKALDSYGLPPPTPVASGLPAAEYCSPRPSGVLERVKYHLRGGAPGPAGAAGGAGAPGMVGPQPGVFGASHVLGAVPVTTVDVM